MAEYIPHSLVVTILVDGEAVAEISEALDVSGITEIDIDDPAPIDATHQVARLLREAADGLEKSIAAAG